MTDDELERLATLIAESIRRSIDVADQSGPWLPGRAQPKAPGRPTSPPAWSGAAQALGDIAPTRSPQPSAHRPDTAELTKAVRAAAAGHGPKPQSAERSQPESSPRARKRVKLPIRVTLGVSRRHLHLSAEHVRALFGHELTVARPIHQPGQFAAQEVVDVVGPKGDIAGVRVVGPVRETTQLELAWSDAMTLGVAPPVAASGALDDSVGDVTLVGPYGRVVLNRGVIVAARHLHVSPEDSARFAIRDGDRVDVEVGTGARRCVFADVLARCGPGHATEVHLDVDEANAAGARSGDTVTIVAIRERGARRRRLVTERDVIAISRSGGSVPNDALLTPSARDRARAMGLIGK